MHVCAIPIGVHDSEEITAHIELPPEHAREFIRGKQDYGTAPVNVDYR